jgi:hypothetical protein
VTAKRYLGSWTMPPGDSSDVYLTTEGRVSQRLGRAALAGLAGRGPRPLAAGEFPGDLPRRAADHRPACAWSVGVKPGLPLLDESLAVPWLSGTTSERGSTPAGSSRSRSANTRWRIGAGPATGCGPHPDPTPSGPRTGASRPMSPGRRAAIHVPTTTHHHDGHQHHSYLHHDGHEEGLT